MHGFTYEPLDLVQPSFRLVRLIKGTEGSIECELFHAHVQDADNSIDYEALSYTWGGTTKPFSISLDGSIFAVTENLYQALYHLREKEEDRILWIDAICINQNDTRERGHQVQQMALIYESARQVIIWLGPAATETDSLFDAIRALERQALNHACNDWKPSDKRWQFLWSTVTIHTLKEVGDIIAIGRCYTDLLERDWFKRVWVLQEVAKARAAKITCGAKAVSARFFALMPPLLGIRPEYHSQSVLDIMPGPARKHSWWTKRRDLYTLLHRFSGSQATDQRDLVYALLGISSDVSGAHPFLPDYSRSEEEVVQTTMVFLLGLQSDSPGVSQLPRWSLTEFQHNLQTLRPRLLPWLSEQRQDHVVEMLLEKLDSRSEGSYVDYTDYYGRSALSWAAIYGREGRIKPLLALGADPSTQDWLGQTPLSLAAENGHDGVVKKLLQHHQFHGYVMDLNSTDWRGRTPLAWAAGRGHEAVVKMLLDMPEVNRSPFDKSGWTPLYLAVSNGHHTIANMLLEPAPRMFSVENRVRTNRQEYLSGYLMFAAGHPYFSQSN